VVGVRERAPSLSQFKESDMVKETCGLGLSRDYDVERCGLCDIKERVTAGLQHTIENLEAAMLFLGLTLLR